jgi:GNAT superfamily N-acetyltransferase
MARSIIGNSVRRSSRGRYLFYRFDTPCRFQRSESRPDRNFTPQLWKPSLRTLWPRGVAADKKLHFLFRALLHIGGAFPTRESGAMLMYRDVRVVHYSAFTPRYWRFPFLAGRDLQIGDTWTHPLYRRQGLAKRALRHLLIVLAERGRGIWYVVEDVNRASIVVAEDCGFRLAGVGTRVLRGKGFDYYEMAGAQTQSTSVAI